MFSKNKNNDNVNQKFRTNIYEDDTLHNDYTTQCIKFLIPIVTVVILLYLFFKYLSDYYYLALPDYNVTLVGLLGSLFIILIAYLIGRFVDHSNPWLKYIFIILCTIAVTLVQISMTYIIILTTFAPLLIATQYSNKKLIIFAYILSLISNFFIVILSYKYGLCDANMVILPESKISVYGQTLSGTIKPLSEVFWSLFLLFILPRYILITAFYPMIIAIVNNRNVELKFKSEHDLLTGFYNRNKYSSMHDFYKNLNSVAILFFDINNLKYTNDTFGHDVGDNLIIKAAESIRNSLNDNMDAYRFGGDEFMVVIPEGNKNDAETFIKEWQINLNLVNSIPDITECDTAYGYATGEGKVFDKVLKQADVNMYENKNKIKLQKI